MAPIDPIELLKAFRPLLTRNGGIKNSEVPRLAGLMRKFSKKLVSRCTYCNILLATDVDVLETFLTNDGWNIVNAWLKDAKEDHNDALLSELLKLLDICPMSVDRLKENDTAKVVKTLSKWDNECLAEKSRAIVNKWMQIIKVGNEQKLIEENAKKKRKKEFERSKSIEETNGTKTKKPKLKIEMLESVDTNNVQAEVDSSTSDSVEFAVQSIKKQLSDADREKQNANSSKPKENGFITNASVNNNVKLESRAPTAKIRYGKSRSIGFDDLSPVTTTAPKAPVKTVAKNNVSPTVNASKDVLLNKTLKANSNDTVNETNESKASRVILIDAKPITPNSLNNKVCHTIKESASFMDAMTNSERSQARKKRRLSAGQSSASVSKSTDDDTADKGDALDEKCEDDDETVTGDEEEAGVEEDFPIELTEVEKQIEAELRGKEITETVDYSNDYAENNYEEEQMFQPNEFEEQQRQPETVTSPSQLKSILCYGRKFGQKKKSVKWVTDDKIKEVKYFELDENERCNVSRTFGEYRLLELKNERQALLNARRGYPESPEKAPIEHFPWTCILVDFPADVVIHERGTQSNEKRVQEERQKSILQEFYPLRELAPDFPQEPDMFEALAGAHEAPVVIPLEDENNPQVIDYSQMELPKPVTGDELPMRSNQFAPYGNVASTMHPSGQLHMQMPGMFPHQMPQVPPLFTNTVMPGVGMLPYPSQQPSLQQQQVSYNTYGSSISASHPSRPSQNQYVRRPPFRKEERRERTRNKVCKFFAKNGRCKFANCQYIHQNPNNSHNDRSNRNSRNYNDNNNVKQETKNDKDDWSVSKSDTSVSTDAGQVKTTASMDWD